MKKLAFLLLIPSLSFGAVTQAAHDQAESTNQQMFDCYLQMKRYLNSVQFILNNSTFVLPGSTFTVTIPQATIDQAADLQLYKNIKSCYPAAFSQFP